MADSAFTKEMLNENRNKNRKHNDGPETLRSMSSFDREMVLKEQDAKKEDRLIYEYRRSEDNENSRSPQPGYRWQTPDGLGDHLFQREQDRLDNKLPLQNTEYTPPDGYQPMFPVTIAAASPLKPYTG